jgi:hypothetical protein
VPLRSGGSFTESSFPRFIRVRTAYAVMPRISEASATVTRRLPLLCSVADLSSPIRAYYTLSYQASAIG